MTTAGRRSQRRELADVSKGVGQRRQAQPRKPREAKATKADLIAEALRHEISVGDLKTGQELLSEAAVVERFQVSRPTYREALRMLESEGFITVARGKLGGARVAEPALAPVVRALGVYLQRRGATMDDLFATLSAFEPLAVRQIASDPKQETLMALARTAAAQEFCTSDREAYRAQESEFRQLLFDHCDNEIVRSVGVILNGLFDRHMAAVARSVPPLDVEEDRLRRGAAAKRRLLTLMAKGDTEGAEKEWRQYLQAYHRLTAELVSGEGTIEFYTSPNAPTTRVPARAHSKPKKT